MYTQHPAAVAQASSRMEHALRHADLRRWRRARRAGTTSADAHAVHVRPMISSDPGQPVSTASVDARDLERIPA